MGVLRHLMILIMRAGLVFLVFGAGWLIYKTFPPSMVDANPQSGTTSVQIVLRQSEDEGNSPLDITVDLYPVDIIAVRHEFFTEPRAGKRFDDFLRERMKGRSPVSAHLDKKGLGTVVLTPGNWWLHAKLSGDEEVEWRLPVNVTGSKQTVELNAQNAYTRSKSF